MKILIVAPKFIKQGRFDQSYYNVYLALKSLGHTVRYFSTDRWTKNIRTFKETLEWLKPDIMFCIMTDDKYLCPDEPWQEIAEETASGRTKTFNFFCDCSWRWNWSVVAAGNFHCFSTPEPAYVERYNKAGHKNVMCSTWHCNSDIYSYHRLHRKNVVGMTMLSRHARQPLLDYLNRRGVPVNIGENVAFGEMIYLLSTSTIGLNLSRNANNGETQMKSRMFEVPACGAMLLTENHKGLEEFYVPDKEIITFETEEEMATKARYLLKNESLCAKIAENGFNRFRREHTSRKRLEKLVEWIDRC